MTSPGVLAPGRVGVLTASAVVVFVVLFWRLGAPSFWDPDEAHYAETTRELIATGDWLAPSHNDQPFFDKPMLFHWLQAVSMAIAGPTEFAARLVPALAALALIGVTAWVGATLLSGDVAIVAALLLASAMRWLMLILIASGLIWLAFGVLRRSGERNTERDAAGARE